MLAEMGKCKKVESFILTIFKIKSQQEQLKMIQKLEKRRKQKGILIELWSHENNIEKYPVVYWESPCPQHHSKKGGNLFAAEAFVKEARGGKILLMGKKNQHSYTMTVNEENIFFDVLIAERSKSDRHLFTAQRILLIS
jgi:hypothetical protein